MKILLVVKSMAIENLGVQYLAAVTKQADHEVKIIELKDALVAAKIWKPDIVGMSIMTGDQQKFKNLAYAIKHWWPSGEKTPMIVVGGPDPTFFSSAYEGDENINMVVSGEAEQIWTVLLGSDARYPDLDSIPWPDRSDFPDRPIRDFIASRGCGGACNYCYNPSFVKMFPDLSRVRRRDPKDVVREVASIRPEFAYFQDSTFGSSLKWLREFTQHYKENKLGPFHVHLRPNQATEERVSLLSDAGCVSIKMALETASDRLRTLINRGNTDNKGVYVASKLLRKKGVALILQNILGLPTASIEDDLETLAINVECNPAYAWASIFQPYPATGLAEICEREGYYTGDYGEIGDNFFDKSVLNFTDEHKEQIEVLQKIFAFCCEMQVMPKIEDLSWERLPKFIHTVMRKVGDRRMFPGII